MFDVEAARDLICRIGRSLFDRGYAHATAGNISVQIPAEAGGGFLITPTDACLGFLEPDTLARLDPQLRQLGGAKASKTIVMHHKIYAATASTTHPARCVIHTHCTHCVAATLAGRPAGGADWELTPPITAYQVMKVGRTPVIAYGAPGATVVADEVEGAVARYAERQSPLRTVMLERLGPVVWGRDPISTMATLEELEETAKLWRTASSPITPLSRDALDTLAATFGARW